MLSERVLEPESGAPPNHLAGQSGPYRSNVDIGLASHAQNRYWIHSGQVSTVLPHVTTRFRHDSRWIVVTASALLQHSHGPCRLLRMPTSKRRKPKNAGARALGLKGTARDDLLECALRFASRVRRNEPLARAIVVVLDALLVAAIRSDETGLEPLESEATDYTKNRAPSERWAKHEAWAARPVRLRSLLTECERWASAPARTVPALADLFPELVAGRFDEVRENVAKLPAGLDPLLLLARLLEACGIPGREAHAQLSFLRVERSRSQKRERRDPLRSARRSA